MWAHIIRRLLYTIPVTFGVLLITFTLFRLIPGDKSTEIAGKHASKETIEEIREEMGWNKPLFLNGAAMKEHGVTGLFDSQFFKHFKSAVTLNFGRSLDTKEKISDMIKRGAVPSLSLMMPQFIISLLISLTISMFVAYFRGRMADHMAVLVCVTGMSIPFLGFILFGQYFFAYKLGWFPIHGYEPGLASVKYLALPCLIGVTAGLGGEVRFYRTVMLDEINSDYIRTAYAKGLGTRQVLIGQMLKNAMIPVITSVVLALPFLFLGSLLQERFFGIPGLGDILIVAITNRDYPVVNALVFIIAILFVLGNLLTDICYTIVDPRVSFD